MEIKKKRKLLKCQFKNETTQIQLLLIIIILLTFLNDIPDSINRDRFILIRSR